MHFSIVPMPIKYSILTIKFSCAMRQLPENFSLVFTIHPRKPHRENRGRRTLLIKLLILFELYVLSIHIFTIFRFKLSLFLSHFGTRVDEPHNILPMGYRLSGFEFLFLVVKIGIFTKQHIF